MLVLCSKFNLILIFLSTTFGFSLFIGLLNAGIRSYNRFSIFIAFFAVVFLCIFIDTFFSKKIKIYYLIVSIVFFTGLLTEISPKDGKYLWLNVYDGYSYGGRYTEIEEKYKECEEIVYFFETAKSGAKVALWDVKDNNNVYLTALSKNIYFNFPKNHEYDLFWQKQQNLTVEQRVENLVYLGYEYIIVSDFTENFETLANNLEELLGSPLKNTSHIKVFQLDNPNKIDIETAKERFYELYQNQ